MSHNPSLPLVGQLWMSGRTNTSSGGTSALMAQDMVKGRFDAFLKSYEHAQAQPKAEPVARPPTTVMPHSISKTIFTSGERSVTAEPKNTAYGQLKSDTSAAFQKAGAAGERAAAMQRAPRGTASGGEAGHIGAEKSTTDEEGTDGHGERLKGAVEMPSQRLGKGAGGEVNEASQHSAVLTCSSGGSDREHSPPEAAQSSVPREVNASTVSDSQHVVGTGDDSIGAEDDAVQGVENGTCEGVSSADPAVELPAASDVLEQDLKENPPQERPDEVSHTQSLDEARETPEAQHTPRVDEGAPQILHSSTENGHHSWIHMDLAEQGHVRVAIHENTEGAKHIHIAADDPQTLHMLTQDRVSLLGALEQTPLPGQALSGEVHVTMGLFVEPKVKSGGVGSITRAGQDEDVSGTELPMNNGRVRPSRWGRGVVDLMA
ncbi:hypothetical protein [Neokomagataea anthophila]|uniref:Flagellar hook-length control protein FliK n=1 Tax=Neokomagataea anthophila TaxID=2826925 RepID=A0ABS5E3U8_9PROT|nr:hypothetical protein [Neokomagataea anthophila]MBR0558570.1 hypothetical protein [Neokomagataea anthophila]